MTIRLSIAQNTLTRKPKLITSEQDIKGVLMCDMKKYIVASFFIIIGIVFKLLMCVYLLPGLVMFIISIGGEAPPQPSIRTHPLLSLICLRPFGVR